MKFKVGDRVKAICVIDNNKNVVDKIGTIVDLFKDYFGVEFDEFIHGHGCNFQFKDGHCWWCNASDLVLVKEFNEKIVITTDGEITTAKMYNGKEVVKTSTAKCSPEYKFDFETGARIAFDRLVEKETEPEETPLLNTKFCVVKGDDVFITGHIYEVVDGKILNGNNERFPIEDDNIIHSVHELYEYFAPLTKRVDKRGWCTSGIEIVEVVDE